MHKIDKNRLPDITIRETGDTYRYDGIKTPLEQVLEVVKDLETAKDGIILVGHGGVGKSQMLFDYWLTHIADGNCFYVNIKMLDGRKHEKAIETYFEETYKIMTMKLLSNCIILLDGINEAPYALRKEHEGGSYLYQEIRGLLGRESIRLVLCGRSEQITECDKIKSIDELFKFNFVYCTVNKLRDEQVKCALQYDGALPNVLKNNQMLTMYMQLIEEGISLDDSQLSTYSILDSFMDEYMGRKFRRVVKGYVDEDLSEQEIGKSMEELYEIYRVLTSVAFSADIDHKAISVYEDVIVNLGILVRRKGKYTWSDELYQCYFMSALLSKAMYFFGEALEKLKNKEQMSKLAQSKLDKCFNLVINGIKLFIDKCVGSITSGDCSWHLLYDTIQMIGEFLIFNSKDALEWLLGPYFVYNTKDMRESIDAFIIFRNILYYLTAQNYGEFFDHPKQFQSYIGVFGNCNSLESIKIHDSVKLIDDLAFSGCGNLKVVQLGSGLKKIGKQAFCDCGCLDYISIPSNVEIIGEAAFDRCEALKKVVLENGIKNIEMCAFYECKKLNTIFIPTSVQKMGKGVFLHCQSLTDIYCEVKSKPKDWDENWTCCDATIHWGVSPEEYERLSSAM